MNAPALPRSKAILYLIIAALLWSSSGIVIKLVPWQPLAIVSARSIFSSLVFLLYLRRFPRRISAWQATAAASYILTQILYVSSLRLTAAANSIFLQYTAPLYIVALGYWLLREKPSAADWLALPVIFAGLGLFLGDSLNAGSGWGNFLAALSGSALALMTVALRAQKDASPAESFLLANLFTALFGFVFVVQQPWSWANWLGIAYLGTFQVGLAFLLYAIAIKTIPALEATLIGTLEPILNPVWVFLFLGERPGPLALAGAGLVFLGVVISTVKAARD
ncbi:MAG: DMT family transporter [Anaerolineales bacterium]